MNPNNLYKKIKKKAETGEEIVYSLVENAYDIHMNAVGWEFNKENKQDIEEKWVRLSDVLKSITADRKKLLKFYDNYSKNLILDEKCGYYVSKEQKKLVKIIKELLD